MKKLLAKMLNQTSVRENMSAKHKLVTTYVVGDVHGCITELINLLDKIQYDRECDPEAGKRIIFLGDLVDRGPSSHDVIEYLSTYQAENTEMVFLMGNHEEIFLKVLSGREEVLSSWFEHGGRETARSYGVDNLGEIHMNPGSLTRRIRAKVPQSHIDFMKKFEDYYQFDDYLCVHAGIKPKVPLQKQNPKDMRWIRERFLSYKKRHPYIVIHGHSIVENPEVHSNRIAVDTGAYKGGKLTASRIRGDQVSFIQS